jgi:serine/threonine protein kinase
MKAIPKKKVLEHQMTTYLEREVKTQLRIHHPSILRLHYYFEDAQNVFLLLELAASGSLFSLLRKRGRLPEDEAARVFLDISSALHHIHRNGVVHRDLKPENILMCGNAAKLADFGWCAELSKDGESRHTFCGTWDYLSPEMVQNEPHDHTVDVWAMGVLLYEMLTGRPPFAASNQMRAMDRITRVDLKVPDTVSPLATDLIGRILVRDKERRLTLPEAVKHSWVRRFIPDAEIVPGKVSSNPLEAAASGGPMPTPQAAAAAHRQQQQAGLSGGASASSTPDQQAVAASSSSSPPNGNEAAAKAKAKLAAIQQQLAEVKDRTIQQHRQQKPSDATQKKPSLMPWCEPSPASAMSDAPSTPASGASPAAAAPPPASTTAAASNDTANRVGEVVSRHVEAVRSNLGTVRTGNGAGSVPDELSTSGAGQADTGSPLTSRKVWQETDTFAAIRKWCRNSPAAPSELAQELDKTLPLVVNGSEEGDQRNGGRSKTCGADDLLADSQARSIARSKTWSVDDPLGDSQPDIGRTQSKDGHGRMAPTPKCRASLSDRRKRKDSPLRIEERDGHAQSLSPVRLRPLAGSGGLEDSYSTAASASALADATHQAVDRSIAGHAVEAGRPRLGRDMAAAAPADGGAATGAVAREEERANAADGDAEYGTEMVPGKDVLPDSAGKGWTDMKNDLDNMTDAFRGQLDRLMRQLEGGRSQ